MQEFSGTGAETYYMLTCKCLHTYDGGPITEGQIPFHLYTYVIIDV